MITKDEEEMIGRCLKSVTGVVDEMIVVDTGSSDRTVEIAREMGAKVLTHTWTDDFSAARNRGLAEAAGRWILYLDADEELEQDHREKLRLLASHTEFDGFFLQVHNYVGNESQRATINPIMRLFPNQPYHRFEGAIHEQIAESICRHKENPRFHLTEVKIHHYGYQQEIVIRKEKVQRNIDLLQKALSEEPDHPFYHFNMGVEYLRTNQVAQALDSFLLTKRMIDVKTLSYAHLLYKYLIRCYFTMANWENAVAVSEEAITLYPDYTDLYHYLGITEMVRGQSHKASEALLKAMEIGPAPTTYHTEEGMGTFQTAFLLGKLEEERGNSNEAINWYSESVRHQTSLIAPLYRICKVMKIAGKETEIPSLIFERFQIDKADAVNKIAMILLHCRCITALRILLDTGKGKKIPDLEREQYLLYGALIQGDLASARRQLANGPLRKVSKGKNEWGELSKQLTWVEGNQDKVTGAVRAIFTQRNRKHPRSVTAEKKNYESQSSLVRLQILLESAYASGKVKSFQCLMQTWLEHQETLEQESRVASTNALIKGIVSVADQHLSHLGQQFTELGSAYLQQLRSKFPFEEGYDA